MIVVQNLKQIVRQPIKLLVAQTVCATSMSVEWTLKGVVPEVLDDMPPQKLCVMYPHVTIEEGNVVTPSQVKSPPLVTWDYDKDSFYTLCMIDPDTPCRTRPIAREWHHWLVVNIPKDVIDEGETLAEYVGAAPPSGSGLHRYVFLLFKQPREIDVSKEKKLTNKSAEGRTLFCIKKFAEKHELGTPIAGNFFEAGFDSQVREIYRQLGLY